VATRRGGNGYGLRWFIAEDDGTVRRLATATCERWFDGEALPAARSGRDLKLLEVVVDLDRHHMVGVLRILPFRQGVREDGRLDVSAATRLAMKRVDLLGPVDPGRHWGTARAARGRRELLLVAEGRAAQDAGHGAAEATADVLAARRSAGRGRHTWQGVA